jgi:glycosyltransferase involved in cell wall biosynthesis
MGMKSPALSIVIPVFNAEKVVSKIVDQILAQSFRDFELVLVNDGSKDNSLKILQGFAEQDKRVKIVNRKNGGPSAARNSGMKKASGELIMFFDADDAIEPDILQKQVAAIRKNRADIAVCGWRVEHFSKSGKMVSSHPITLTNDFVDVNQQNLKKYVLRSIGEHGQLYNLWNKIMKVDVIRKNNLLFNEKLRFGEDLLFAFDFFEHAKKMQIIPDPLYRYREASATSVFSSSSLDVDFRFENFLGLEKFAGKNPDEETKVLVNWVKFRWFGSFCLNIFGSKLSPDEKRRRITALRGKVNLRPSRKNKFLPHRHILLEKIASMALRFPGLLCFGVKTIMRLKHIVKSLQK